MNIPNCPICSKLLIKNFSHYLDRNSEYYCSDCKQKGYFVKWSPLYWSVSIKDSKVGWYTISSTSNENHAYTKGILKTITFNYSITFQDSLVILQKYINNQAFL